MSEQDRLEAEKLVQIHRARDEWDGNLIVGYLGEHGIEAVFHNPPAVPPLDAAERLMGTNKIFGVFVLEHQAEQARRLVEEFLQAPADEGAMEEAAAHKSPPNRMAIAELRSAVREERRTFEFLGWMLVVFLGAAALLWAIWPAWLKTYAATSGFRWVMVILLGLAAVYAGSWVSKRIK